MAAPTLIQLRDRLGRELVQQPNNALLHGALRVINRSVERKPRLNKVQKLLAARAVALALDAAGHGLQLAGDAAPMLSDALDPARTPELSWWDGLVTWWQANPQKAETDPALELANMLDHGLEAVKEGSGQAALDVANALDRAYEAVGESASNFGNGVLNAVNKTSFSLILPVGLGVAGMLALGFMRHGHARS